jgi:hypothetical protein
MPGAVKTKTKTPNAKPPGAGGAGFDFRFERGPLGGGALASSCDQKKSPQLNRHIFFEANNRKWAQAQAR